MSKLERLLNLTAVLLDTARPLSAEQIRAKVHGYPPAGSAFHRAFERDKDDLRVLGIPLLVERVPATDPPQDGYRINADEYYLPDPALEPDELASLHLASIAVRVDGLADEEALWKLGGQDDVVNGEPLVASLPSNPILVPIFQAITNKRQLSFVYGDQKRQVDPWRLDFRRGRWYLSGFDHSRQAERSFRLDRVDGDVEMTGSVENEPTPSPGKASDRKGWELGESETIDVQLRVDKDLVETVSHQLGENKQRSEQPNPDGSVTFTVPVSNREAFRSFALGFLEHVEVVEPPEMRNDMIDWLTRFKENK